ncbi:MAG: YbaN family protein [Acidiferrobacterales bacterium]|nr:YbaN family protein [Acidiferrobacterales bacterium]
MFRFFALILAYFFLILDIIGIFLPGLPTVPFLLLTAWFSAKGSERLNKWLYEHPRLGPPLKDWEEHGAVSRKSKVLAILMICGSWAFLYHNLSNVWLFRGVTCIFIIVCSFLITRPEPQSENEL